MVLEAAMTVFGVRGFLGTPTIDVADAAGISHALPLPPVAQEGRPRSRRRASPTSACTTRSPRSRPGIAPKGAIPRGDGRGVRRPAGGPPAAADADSPARRRRRDAGRRHGIARELRAPRRTDAARGQQIRRCLHRSRSGRGTADWAKASVGLERSLTRRDDRCSSRAGIYASLATALGQRAGVVTATHDRSTIAVGSAARGILGRGSGWTASGGGLRRWRRGGSLHRSSLYFGGAFACPSS